MIRRVVYDRTGGPEVLHVVEVEPGMPAPGEVAVAIAFAGVNPIDCKLRSGERGAADFDGPRVIGSDGSGIVVAVGDEDGPFAVGDPVIVFDAKGTYADQVVVASSSLLPLPTGLELAQAAAIGIPWGTAYQALDSLGVGAGDVLLLLGGSGSVGQAAIQFAVRAGAVVVASASARNLDRIRTLGAIPLERGPGLVERAGLAAPGEFTVALVAAGGEDEILASVELVADLARVGSIVLGARAPEWGIRAWRAGSPVPLTTTESAARREGVRLGAELIGTGAASVELAASFTLDRAPEAHAASESGRLRGKILLTTTDRPVATPPAPADSDSSAR